MRKADFSKNGFTLIEIVMVLVLLGILAAVAVPKYFDLQEKAEEAVAKTVENEVQARFNGAFAKAMLEGGSCDKFSLSYGGGKATSVTELALVVVMNYNSESDKAQVTIAGDAGGSHVAPLLISVDGTNYKYPAKLYFPDCINSNAK